MIIINKALTILQLWPLLNIQFNFSTIIHCGLNLLESKCPKNSSCLIWWISSDIPKFIPSHFGIFSTVKLVQLNIVIYVPQVKYSISLQPYLSNPKYQHSYHCVLPIVQISWIQFSVLSMA